MVGRLFSLFSREVGGLHEAAFLLGLSAIASQLLGLVRDRLLAGTFGAGTTLDVYYSAFRVPDLIYVSIASFVSVTVLIPFIMEGLTAGRQLETRQFINQLFSVFLVVMAVVSVAAFLLMPILARIVAPGFNTAQTDLLVTLSRVLLLSPVFLGLSNLFGGVTQGLRRFFVYAASPIFYNLGIIAGVIVFYPFFGTVGLAYGVALGALFHLAVQLPIIYQTGFWPRLVWPTDWQPIKEVVLTSFPRTITLGAHQLALLALMALASTFGVGAIAVFNLAWNLQSVPLAIVGVSYSVAAFPALARLFAQGERATFLKQIKTATRHIAFWSMIATVFFIVLRAQVVRVILGSGQFGWTETRLVAAALAIFAMSVAAQSLVLLLVRGYYAAGRTMVPLFVNTLSSLLVIAAAFLYSFFFANWPFSRWFLEALLRVGDVPGTEVLLLPLAFSTGLLVNLAVLWHFFHRDFGSLGAAVRASLWQSFAAATFGGFVAYQVLSILANRLDLDTFRGIFTQGLGAGLTGLLATFILLWALDNREIGELRVALQHKFWRAAPIAPGPEEL